MHYPTEAGHWIWSGRDSAVVAFGAPHFGARIGRLPENTGDLFATVFDNTWNTNFVADSHGIFEFNFDLIWLEKLEDGASAGKTAWDMAVEPVVIVRL